METKFEIDGDKYLLEITYTDPALPHEGHLYSRNSQRIRPWRLGEGKGGWDLGTLELGCLWW